MSKSKPPVRDRRAHTDRRTRPTSPLSFSSMFGSRRHVRRADDRQIYLYVDRYSLRSVFVVLGIVLLSLTDAMFTLQLVAKGAQEINPVMDFFLQKGPLPFLIAKYLITGTCLVLFIVHKNHYFLKGKIRVKTLMIMVFIMYVVLIAYELVLFLK